ncbi:MAG: hypothetical protein MJZ20_03655 [Bacteroidaceae bacterium]|nr:hypothetical protein [Bacteroidaceae bacterium]
MNNKNPFGIEQTNKIELLNEYKKAKENFLKNFYSKNKYLYLKSVKEYNEIKNKCMLAGIRL